MTHAIYGHEALLIEQGIRDLVSKVSDPIVLARFLNRYELSQPEAYLICEFEFKRIADDKLINRVTLARHLLTQLEELKNG